MITITTVGEARKHGYEVARGDYPGDLRGVYCDNDARRWYVDHESQDYRDRRGAGYPTRRAALEAIEDHVNGLYPRHA